MLFVVGVAAGSEEGWLCNSEMAKANKRMITSTRASTPNMMNLRDPLNDREPGSFTSEAGMTWISTGSG